MRILVIEPTPQENLEKLIEFCHSHFNGSPVTILLKNSLKNLPGGFESIVFDPQKVLHKEIRNGIIRDLKQRNFSHCLLSFDHSRPAHHFYTRMVPILVGIPTVIVVDGDAASTYGRTKWFFSSALAETLQRALLWTCLKLDVLVACFLVLWSGIAHLLPGKRKTKNRKLVVVHMIKSLGLGGAQRQLLNLVRNLNTEKFSVRVCLINREDGFFEERFREAGIEFQSFDLSSTTFFYTSIIWKAFRYFQTTRADIVHNWLAYSNLFGCPAANLARVPIIFNSIRSLHLFNFPWYVRWFRAIEWISARLTTSVLVNSRAVLEDYSATTPIHKKRLKLIYNGIEVSAERRYSKKEWQLEGIPTLAIIGRLSFEKDHETFLRACQLLRMEVENYRAFVIGDGDLLLDSQERAVQLGLQDHVQFLGVRNDVEKILGLIDVVVLTSKEEGLPNALLEAMAAALPVVSTRAPGALDIVEDQVTGILVDIGNAQELAKACARILKDARLAKEMGEKGLEKVKKDFSIPQMVRSIENLYLRSADPSFTPEIPTGKD